MSRSYTGLEGWIVLARLAELASEHCAAVSTVDPRDREDRWPPRKQNETHEQRYDVTIVLPNDACAEHAFRSPISASEGAQLAERMMLRWAELAPAVEVVPEMPDHVRRAECPTCGRAAGTWCTPVHDGERAARGWAHPAREFVGAEEMRPHDDARSIAVRVLADWRGRGGEIKKLAESVLAYARHDVRSRRLRAQPTHRLGSGYSGDFPMRQIPRERRSDRSATPPVNFPQQSSIADVAGTHYYHDWLPTTCRGDCSRGGDGPPCGLPGCSG